MSTGLRQFSTSKNFLTKLLLFVRYLVSWGPENGVCDVRNFLFTGMKNGKECVFFRMAQIVNTRTFDIDLHENVGSRVY